MRKNVIKTRKLLKNTCKNIALVVLVLLMGVLTVCAWGAGLLASGNTARMSPLAQLLALLPTGDGGYVRHVSETAAAYPVRLAISGEDGLVGATYQDALGTVLYDALRPLLADGLTHAEPFVQATDSALQKALRGKTIAAEYAGKVPLSLLAGWFGGSVRAENRNLHTGTFVLTRDGLLFLRDGTDGTLYYARTKLDTAVWDRVASTVSASSCDYAGLLPQEDYGKLHPETLLPGEPQAFPIYTVRAANFRDAAPGESMQRLLTAFFYDPLQRAYEEDSGATQVFVGDASALRVSGDGTVRYKATSVTGGLYAYQDGEMREDNALAARVEFAQEILSGVLGSIGSSAPGMLQEIRYDEASGNWIVTFTQTLSGVPVRTAASGAAARFEFSGGLLVSAELHLLVYEATGEKLYVVPAKQAGAAAYAAGKGYVVAYQIGQDGRALAHAYLAN